jgi:hypothetical protein
MGKKITILFFNSDINIAVNSIFFTCITAEKSDRDYPIFFQFWFKFG